MYFERKTTIYSSYRAISKKKKKKKMINKKEKPKSDEYIVSLCLRQRVENFEVHSNEIP